MDYGKLGTTFSRSFQCVVLIRSQGRAGYGATTEGTWPYSYDSCDLGTFPNQTTASGEPAAALTGGSGGSAISFLPGQRLSACTCSGSDHPGPTTSTGRGVPEIDIIEHQIDTSIWQGEVSQSYQIAPFNYQYQFDNSSSVTTIYNDTITKFNSYKGATYQQAVSAVTYIDETLYNGTGYGAYGYEWFSNPDKRDEGYITWYSNGVESWTITAGTIGADSTVEISERLIPEEPLVGTIFFYPECAKLTYIIVVHHPQPWHVIFVPAARLQAPDVPEFDVYRLRASVPTLWDGKWVDL